MSDMSQRSPIEEVDLRCLSQNVRAMENALGDMNTTLQDLTKVLCKMDEWYTAVEGRATQPIPAVPTTSSSAWAPLLRGHMDQILPVIDKWRSSLDTMLVFQYWVHLQVALFSAVVTTFIAQSLSGLAENPADTTNQHLANITEILIAIHSVNIAKMGGLNLTQASEFKPEPHVIRTNFYWSLALISSISVACLTVMTRGSLAKILRSTHTQTYQKLADFHSRWNQVDKVLGPTIEVLLQLLVVPVVLFLIGLLDVLISASLPLLHSSILIFLAGVIACICSFGVATFAVYIITRGSFDASDSLLTSWFFFWLPLHKDANMEPPHLSDERLFQVDTERNSFLQRTLLLLRLPFCGTRNATQVSDVETASPIVQGTPLLSRWNFLPNSRRNDTAVELNAIMHPREGVDRHPLLAARYQETFHSVICTIHDDDALDHAIAVLPSLIQERRLNAGPGQILDATSHEIKTLLHLLSMDVSIRCNLAAASIISASVSVDRLNKLSTFHYDPPSILDLVSALCLAAKRNLAYQSQMTNTILHLSLSLMRDARLPSGIQNESEEFRVLCANAPVLALLVIPFSDIRQFEDPLDIERLRLKVVNHAYDCLVSKMEQMDDYLLAPNKAFLSVVEEMDVDLTTTLLQIGNTRSHMPFLLNLLPVKLGTGIHDDIGPNYDCFLAVLQLIFTPNVSQLTLKSMVKSIRAVIIYHQNHFRGTLPESLDLFVVTEKILHIMSNSLIDFYDSEGLAWENLFQTCILLVQFIFDPNLHEFCQNTPRAPLRYPHPSPPRLLHEVIIEILNSIPKIGHESHLPADFRPENFLLSDETKSLLLSIEVRRDYTHADKIDLLNAFRLLDPSLPSWPLILNEEGSWHRRAC